MKFKKYINEKSSGSYEIANAILELGKTTHKLKNLSIYSDDLKLNPKTEEEFGKGVGEQLNKDFTIYDENGKKFDFTKTKIAFFGSDRPDLHVFGGYNSERGDIYNYLYNDGKFNFGFNKLIDAIGKGFGWKTVNKLITDPVEKEVEERFIIPFVEDIAQDFIDWLEDVSKECRKVNKKVFGDPDFERSPLIQIIKHIEDYLKEYSTPKKMAVKGFNETNVLVRASWKTGDMKGDMELGDKDVSFWIEIIDGFRTSMDKFREDIVERIEKSSSDCVSAYAESLDVVLRDVGLKGKTFVAMTKLASDKDTGIYLYEIDSVSDIEDIKEIFRERTVKYRENAEKERKEKEEWDREHSWYKRYGSRYDF